jgi:integrase
VKGSTYKRCKCRDDDGKELGAACPKLKRKGTNAWSSTHGTWYYRLELDAGPGGKRRTIRRGGFETSDDVEEALDEAKTKAKSGVNIGKKQTVGQYLEAWARGKKRTRGNTNRGYESMIRNHLLPHLGHIPLDKLRAQHISDMFDAIDEANELAIEANAERARLRELALAAGRRRDRKARQEALDAIEALPKWKRPTGPVTKMHIRDTLRNALGPAVVEGILSVNPASIVEMDPAKRAKPLVWTTERIEAWTKEYERAVEAAREAGGGGVEELMQIWRSLPRPSKVMVWLPADTGTFLEHAAGHRLYAAFRLMAFTALRRGETAGAEWSDLELKLRQLAVTTNRVQLGWKVEEGAPKTEASEAYVALDAVTCEVLKVHRKQQLEDQLAWGEAWIDSGKIFVRENGEPLHPSVLSIQFERLAFDAGLPPIRLHDLRHGAATMGLAAGLDTKVISAMLRHSTTTITRDTYTSILPDVARAAAETVAAMVPLKAVNEGAPETGGLPTGSQRSTSRIGQVTRNEKGQVNKADLANLKAYPQRDSNSFENVPDTDA